MTKLQKGDPAPDFHGPSTDGTTGLADVGGSWTVLYFYPRSFTPGCTTESCDFRDALPGMDAAVVGVAPDPVEDLRRFADEYGLPFPLVSDVDGSRAREYGAFGTRTLYGREVTGVIRSTFVIDPEGRIAEAMTNVRAKGHVERVQTVLQGLRG